MCIIFCEENLQQSFTKLLPDEQSHVGGCTHKHTNTVHTNIKLIITLPSSVTNNIIYANLFTITCSEESVLVGRTKLRPDERLDVGRCAQMLEGQDDADAEPG